MEESSRAPARNCLDPAPRELSAPHDGAPGGGRRFPDPIDPAVEADIRILQMISRRCSGRDPVFVDTRPRETGVLEIESLKRRFPILLSARARGNAFAGAVGGTASAPAAGSRGTGFVLEAPKTLWTT